MTIVWNLISLSISLWSRLLISLIKLHVSKLATISNKVMAETKKYSNQRGLSSLILSIKLSVLLAIIVMLIVSMPKSNRLEIFREPHLIPKTFLFLFLPAFKIWYSLSPTGCPTYLWPFLKCYNFINNQLRSKILDCECDL